MYLSKSDLNMKNYFRKVKNTHIRVKIMLCEQVNLTVSSQQPLGA